MGKALVAGLLATAFGAGAIGYEATGQQAPASADAAKCQAVSAGAFGATKASGKWVEADAAKGLPAYCEVTGTLAPAPGSNITVVYRLPASWNGKLLGLGGGGWAGNITLMSATPGLKAGYATAQTDGGHPSTSPWDTSWTSNPEAVTDFQYRAINRMTVAGKDLVKAYYGTPQKRAYFHGCSTGGRMALMEAQRFPNDYDAIISEAPVYSLQVQTSAVLRNKTIAAGGGFTADQLKLINQSVLKACDAKDGVTDGVIANPRACAWKPSSLAGTLTPRQITALETLYDGIRSKKDNSWAMFPLEKGGEAGWSMFIKTDGTGTDQATGGGMPGLSPLLFGSRQVDFAKLDPDTDVPEARSSAFAKAYEATNPDLSGFFAHGGRLLMWHGESDPGPSPVGTIDYVTAARKANRAAATNLQLFLAPGVGHCRGGVGADVVDNLSTLDQWVESGKMPQQVIAHRADGTMTRPLCAWPKVARFKGAGDANDPAGYVCETPKS